MAVSAISLLVLACAAAVTSAVGLATQEGTLIGDWRDCLKQDDATTCDVNVDCNWCKGKVATGCYPMKSAKMLPKKLYTCDKPFPKVDTLRQAFLNSGLVTKVLPSVKVPGECGATSAKTCLSPCVWCTSAAVGSGCFTESQAKKLPSAVFHCDFAPSQ